MERAQLYAIQRRTMYQGAIFGLVTYVLTCSIAGYSWQASGAAAAFAIGFVVNALTLAASYWVGRGLKTRSAAIAVAIGLMGYAAILAAAITLAFTRFSWN